MYAEMPKLHHLVNLHHHTLTSSYFVSCLYGTIGFEVDEPLMFLNPLDHMTANVFCVDTCLYNCGK